MAIETLVDKEVKTRQCPLYRVIMHNDPITHQDFVVGVLKSIFRKEDPEAVKLMLEIHHQGSAMVGVYALEHAEMKVDQTHSLARARNFPLACTIEPA